MLTETDPLTAHYITKRMLREVRLYKPTRPFNAVRTCKDKRCVWHTRKSQ
jgi:hypothetical protein